MRGISRRAFFTAGTCDPQHLSSAVVLTLPGRQDEICDRLAQMQGVEVHVRDTSRVVITIEGNSSNDMGDILLKITVMDGVLAANMVFEHADDARGAV